MSCDGSAEPRRAILPEVDHVARRQLGAHAARAFQEDLVLGAFLVEWEGSADLARGAELERRHEALGLGLVDGVVMAMAERLEADAIATMDLGDFGAVTLRGMPKLYPRDL